MVNKDVLEALLRRAAQEGLTSGVSVLGADKRINGSYNPSVLNVLHSILSIFSPCLFQTDFSSGGVFYLEHLLLIKPI